MISRQDCESQARGTSVVAGFFVVLCLTFHRYSSGRFTKIGCTNNGSVFTIGDSISSQDKIMSSGSSDTDKLFEEIKLAAKESEKLQAWRQSAVDTEKDSSPHNTPADDKVREIPNYKVLSEIHRGGQGVVFKALQKSTNRTVALKFMLQGSFATSRQRYRFEREIDLASSLNHPQIVTIYDSGIVDGQPFCAMEFVDGQPLTIHCFENESIQQKRIRNIMELFLKVSEAVGYAHQHGVIHRDLKPSNILVDQQGQPHVLDFGLAKVLGDDAPGEHSPRTMTGEFVGTLAYASPEQASAKTKNTDTRSDVYSLGVVFYEVLTGKMPYDVDGSIAATLTNISRIDPVRPSLIANGVDADIETILLKALSKDPQRRYQNAVSLADDIGRYMAGAPIDARRDSNWYVFKKTLRRHWIFAAAASICLVVLVAALIAVSAFYLQAVEDRDIATEAQENEEVQREKAEIEKQAAITARENAEFSSYRSRIAAADASIRVYDSYDAVRNLSAAPENLRRIEWWWLLGRINLSSRSSNQVDAHVPIVRYTPDQEQVISVSIDGNIHVYDIQTLTESKTISVGVPLTSIAVHPNGTLAYVGQTDGKVSVVDLENEAIIRALETGSTRVNRIEYLPGLNQIAAACGWDTNTPGVTCVWDANNFELLHQLTGHEGPHMSLAFDPNKNLLATGSDDVRIWDTKNGELAGKLPPHGDWVYSIAFDPNQRLIATGAGDSLIRIWRTSSYRLYRTIYGHNGYVRSLQFNKDGSELLSASEDRTIRTWNAHSLVPKRVLWGSLQGVTWAEYRSDEKQIVSSAHGRVKLWNTNAEFQKELNEADYSSVSCVSFGQENSLLVTGGHSGFIKHWQFEEPKSSTTIYQEESGITGIHVYPDKQLIAWCSEAGKARVYDCAADETRLVCNENSKQVFVQLVDGGQQLLVAGQDAKIRWFNCESSKMVNEYSCDSSILGCVIDQAQQRLITAHRDCVVVRELMTGQEKLRWSRQAAEFEGDQIPVSINHDGSLLAIPHEQTTIGIFDTTNGKLVSRLLDHSDGIQALQFTPDGTRLLTSARDGKIKFWDTQRWVVVLTIRDLVGYPLAIAIAPDSDAIAVGQINGRLIYWNAAAQ